MTNTQTRQMTKLARTAYHQLSAPTDDRGSSSTLLACLLFHFGLAADSTTCAGTSRREDTTSKTLRQQREHVPVNQLLVSIEFLQPFELFSMPAKASDDRVCLSLVAMHARVPAEQHLPALNTTRCIALTGVKTKPKPSTRNSWAHSVFPLIS